MAEGSTTGKLIFVGNLSFKTQEADLSKEFEQAGAGKVVNANIITRGTRSLGYGFVEMESAEAAQKAVNALNKKSVDGREINVEIAKPRVEGAPAGGSNGGAPGTGSPAGAGGRGRRPAGRGRRPAGGAAGGPRRRRPDGEAAPGEGGAPQAGGAAPGGPRRPRAPRAPRPDAPPRAESATTLFVANLPFSVDDAGLTKIFEGLNIKDAHVVRKRNDRSKGFGFVEFNNVADQQAALTAINNKQVEGRELIVKVALTEPTPSAGAAAAGSPAAAAATPAPQ